MIAYIVTLKLFNVDWELASTSNLVSHIVLNRASYRMQCSYTCQMPHSFAPCKFGVYFENFIYVIPM